MINELKRFLKSIKHIFTCFERISAALGFFFFRYVTESHSDSAIFLYFLLEVNLVVPRSGDNVMVEEIRLTTHALRSKTIAGSPIIQDGGRTRNRSVMMTFNFLFL
jgi:hypothetical protein